jgi:AAA+ ATPase superfamily predicted ATPase
MESNPFTFGNPIKAPERFVGRKAEIRQIASRLLSSAHESTSIVGERRIGKTSLLYHLSNPKIASSLGLTEDKYCIAYIDFQGLSEITPTKFWNRVLRKVQKKIKIEEAQEQIEDLRSHESIDLFDLEDLFETISDAGLHVVLMLDEFEYVAQNENFKIDFFGGLRALAIHSNLSLITSTSKQLVDLAHSEEIKGSPFFNIFAVVILRSFSNEETTDFINSYARLSNQQISEEQGEFIRDFGGNIPIFLQMAGHALLESKVSKSREDDLPADAAKLFAEQAAQHFSYFWSQISESEKITLLSILAYNSGKARIGKKSTMKNLLRINPQALIDTKSLDRRGLIVKTDDVFHIFSPGLQAWIIHEITSNASDEKSDQSAEDWLKTSGQIDSTGSIKVLPKFKSKYWSMAGKLAKEISFEILEHTFFSAITGKIF